MATGLKKITELTTKASVDLGNDYAVTTNGESSNRIQLSTIINKAKNDTMTMWEAQYLDILMQGVNIAYCDDSNTPKLSKLSEWASLQSAGKEPLGISLIGEEQELLIAIHESRLPWGNSNTALGAYSTTSRQEAIADFNGRSNTTAILAHGETDTGHVTGYCNSYSRTNGDGYGITAGNWWLPSLGQVAFMWQNLLKINVALSLLPNPTLLKPGSYYASSTEAGPSQVWLIRFSDFLISNLSKIGSVMQVRPVSSIFI